MRSIPYALVALVAICTWGCSGADSGGDKDAKTSPGSTTQVAGKPAGTQGMTNAVYCIKCGQVKGSEDCCKEDAEKCSCGMAKGSPLCCVDLPADMKDGDFCHCGWPVGHDNCCKEGAEVCTGCEMHKGSPLCCKIKKDDS